MVYQGDVALDPSGADLSGATLGIAAFRIVNVSPGADAFASVDAGILDADYFSPKVGTGGAT